MTGNFTGCLPHAEHHDRAVVLQWLLPTVRDGLQDGPWRFGIIAALNQLQIAENVVNAVLYASLAAIVGITIVAVGGGGIGPMRTRWESALAKVEAEAPRVKQQVTGAVQETRSDPEYVDSSAKRAGDVRLSSG